MHNTVKNLLDIDNNIKVHLNKLNINSKSKIIAVSKTFKIDKIFLSLTFCIPKSEASIFSLKAEYTISHIPTLFLSKKLKEPFN